MKLKKAFEWLAEPTSVCGGIGEKSTRTCLHDVTAFGNKLDENNMIAVNAEKTRNLVDNFCILIEEKKVLLKKFSKLSLFINCNFE